MKNLIKSNKKNIKKNFRMQKKILKELKLMQKIKKLLVI